MAANPERLVWGTDLPDIGPHTPGGKEPVTFMPHDNAALLALLFEACDQDCGALTTILADNPARLYGFVSRAESASHNVAGNNRSGSR